jgi:hypothetical protein
LVLQQPGQFLTQGGFAAPHEADEINPHKKKRFCPGWTEAQKKAFFLNYRIVSFSVITLLPL